MERFVLNIFKAIMFAMIFIFIFDMTSYFYRAITLNNKMENIATSLQRVVMENNYLPDGSYTEYVRMLQLLAQSYNGTTPRNNVNGSVQNNRFIEGFFMNYGDDIITPGGVSTLRNYFGRGADNKWLLNTDMKTVGNYGSVTAVQIGVKIYQPLWGFSGRDYNSSKVSNVSGGELGAPNFNRLDYRTTDMLYTYYVPCLHYQTLEN